MKQNRGQALVESLLLSLVLAAALLLPLGGRPVATTLLDALRGVLQAQAFVLSII